MYNFVRKGIRGGIVQCYRRHAIANNKYLEDYDDKNHPNILCRREQSL